MAREYHRSRRVEEQIQRILAESIRQHVRDPRVVDVVITSVKVSRDLAVARVYYAPLAGTGADPGLQAGLQRAAGYLRTQLARELDSRTVPELRFLFDEQSEQTRRLDALIDEARRQDDAGQPPDDAPDADTDTGAGRDGEAS